LNFVKTTQFILIFQSKHAKFYNISKIPRFVLIFQTKRAKLQFCYE